VVAFAFAQGFAEIEASVYRRWDRDDPAHLAAAATDALEDCRELLAFDPAECLQWALDPGVVLPEQAWLFDFGQPAITVVRNADFRIDLLYWVENSTAVHDHITCGAFAAVLGDRLHGRYRFAGEERLGPWVETGRLSRLDLEVMRQGDARPLRPELIHDVFWLGKPSVTLVVRCAEHPGPTKRNPRSFWAPGLALVPKAHHETSLVSRRAEGLALMRMANPALYEDALRAVLDGSDPSLAYYAFTAAAVSSPEVLDTALDSLTQPNAVIPHLVEARAALVRRSHLGGLYTDDVESRLLVGLLWAEADLQGAGDMIAAVFPDESVGTVADAAVSALEDVDPDTAREVRAMFQPAPTAP
jgi:hypothetical protein